MKFLGTFILAICPIIFGFLKSINLKQNKNTIEKIIELLNWIIVDLKFKNTDTKQMFYNLSLEENFKNLKFLQNFEQKNQIKPFPQLFKQSIEEWECPLRNDDKELLKSLSSVLGATDSKGQILNLKHTIKRFEESLKNAQKTYISKGKISRSLGTLLGIAIFIIFI